MAQEIHTFIQQHHDIPGYDNQAAKSAILRRRPMEGGPLGTLASWAISFTLAVVFASFNTYVVVLTYKTHPLHCFTSEYQKCV